MVGVSASGDGKEGGLGTLLIVIFLYMLFSGDPNVGFFFYAALGLLIVIVLPLLIALGFSILTAMRPSTRP